MSHMILILLVFVIQSSRLNKRGDQGIRGIKGKGVIEDRGEGMFGGIGDVMKINLLISFTIIHNYLQTQSVDDPNNAVLSCSLHQSFPFQL